MKLFVAFLLLFSINSYSCVDKEYDVVILGDSQTGAFWAKSYFGNFVAKCLRGDFRIYGRGATQPIHWITSSKLDKVPTIQRDADNHHENIGTFSKVPLCKKRVKNILQTHRPKKVLFFFGDNLLHRGSRAIERQFSKLTDIVKEANILKENCYILTPTFEMEVKSRRNSKYKNLKNTKKVINAAIKGAADKCQVISGIELMADSPLLKKNNTLKRIKYNNLPNCVGKSSNDNTHYCGEAAKELADKVCTILNN